MGEAPLSRTRQPQLQSWSRSSVCGAHWTGHAGTVLSLAASVLTAVTALLPCPQAAIQTRPSATSAPLSSVLPSTSTPEPHQTASATELVAIFSVWGALDTQGPLAASVLTAVTALLPYPQAAIQTRPSATSAPLSSVLPFTSTPEAAAPDSLSYRAGRDLQCVGRTGHARALWQQAYSPRRQPS